MASDFTDDNTNEDCLSENDSGRLVSGRSRLERGNNRRRGLAYTLFET